MALWRNHVHACTTNLVSSLDVGGVGQYLPSVALVFPTSGGVGRRKGQPCDAVLNLQEPFLKAKAHIVIYGAGRQVRTRILSSMSEGQNNIYFMQTLVELEIVGTRLGPRSSEVVGSEGLFRGPDVLGMSDLSICKLRVTSAPAPGRRKRKSLRWRSQLYHSIS